MQKKVLLGLCRRLGGLAFVVLAMVLISAPVAAVVFTEVTETAGVDYLQKQALGKTTPPFWQQDITGGAAAGDVDGDGWVDLLVTRQDAPPILFHNQRNGTFKDATVGSGLGMYQATGSNGAGFGDIDNDGDLDLYVTSFADSRFYLYINDGKGHFVEEAEIRGAATSDGGIHFGQGVAFGDYDRDGFLDVFVSEWRWDMQPQKPGFWPTNNRLLRNNGAANPGHFSDVTNAAGVSIRHIIGLQKAGSWGFVPRFDDLDGDGYPEITLVADFGESRLFWNDGDGTFTDGTESAMVGTDQHGMGSAVADFDGDGDLDWFITSIVNPDMDQNGNRMYVNNGDRTFIDQTDLAGVRHGDWGWAASALDFDNDGDEDLIMTNGVHFERPDLFAEDPMHLWENDGQGRFTEVSDETGIVNTDLGKGLLTFDYDQDGDLDVFVVNHVGHPVLYRNDGGNENGWLQIVLEGSDSNAQGIGAMITVTPEANGASMVQEMNADSNFLAMNEPLVHFGIGPGSELIHRVHVRWPSGLEQTFSDVPANSRVMIVEAGSLYVIPEPGMLALIGAGLLWATRRRSG